MALRGCPARTPCLKYFNVSHRFPAVVHVSQKLCTFHKPPNNVRVQLHWGDQTRSPDNLILI
jgi:hypothetical protein